MSNMNKKTHDKLYASIEKRDGDCCHFCGKKPPEHQLVIDHKENDNRNNELYNLQLLCRACNYKKNPRRPFDQCVRDPKQPAEDAIAINRAKEPKFREWVYDEIENGGHVLWDELVYSGAELLEISIETTRKYLIKMVSKVGILERILTADEWNVKYKKSI